jgi:hypothetical protein
MRSRRARTMVALAPILIAVLVAASVAACGRDHGPKPPRPTTPVAAGLGGANVAPAAIATPNPDQAPANHHHSPGHDDNDSPGRGR